MKPSTISLSIQHPTDTYSTLGGYYVDVPWFNYIHYGLLLFPVLTTLTYWYTFYLFIRLFILVSLCLSSFSLFFLTCLLSFFVENFIKNSHCSSVSKGKISHSSWNFYVSILQTVFQVRIIDNEFKITDKRLRHCDSHSLSPSIFLLGKFNYIYVILLYITNT